MAGTQGVRGRVTPRVCGAGVVLSAAPRLPSHPGLPGQLFPTLRAECSIDVPLFEKWVFEGVIETGTYLIRPQIR